MFKITYFTIFTALFFMSLSLSLRESLPDTIRVQKEKNSLLQMETGEGKESHAVYYDDLKNCFYAYDSNGKRKSFFLEEEGYGISGYGLYQNWLTLSAAKNMTGDAFVKIETGSVIDRFISDENKACWGVKEGYLTFDGSEFILADTMYYISYIDKWENSWEEDIFVNNKTEKSLLLHKKYTAAKNLSYEITK